MSKIKSHYFDVDKVEDPWQYYERIVNDPEYRSPLVEYAGRKSIQVRNNPFVGDDAEEDED